ncbi:surfeit locus protein 1 isoform X2 [Camellia sinensis]|uniref:surfeit locus protein 1 isoform X2 n=1 Tax=Camellia sinensis TaxID=4442 RepID=UPI00103628AE|nr:surfeit locus protein 1 isoform X2 [Camellia sinensis]
MASVSSISKTLAKKLRRGRASASASAVTSFRWKSFPPLPPSLSFSSSSSSAAISSSSAPPSTSTSPSQSQEKQKGSRWSKLLLFVPGAITFGLGTWQLFRRQDKIKLLEYRQERLGSEPISGNKLAPSSNNLDALEFRRVVCKGLFDEKKSIYVGPRSRSISGVTENGYFLITPFMPIPNNPESVQSPILVNRGWIPRSWRDKFVKVPQDDEQLSSIASSSAQENERSSWWRFWSKNPKIIEEQVPPVTPLEIVGVVRGSEKPSIFVPANDPNSSQWFYVDVPAIARTCGLPENTIYIEDVNENVNPSNPYPVPKDANELIRSSVMPQDHLNYTFTWYSLSAAVTFMAYKRLMPKKTGHMEWTQKVQMSFTS